jgi:hypothetical protein
MGMKNIVFLCLVSLIFACGSEYQHEYSEQEFSQELSKYNSRPLIIENGSVVLTEVVDIPPFEDVSLELMHKNVKFRQGKNELEFNIQKFVLGERTVDEQETGLVKESSGQYLMVVGNKGERNFSGHVNKNLDKGANHLLAFLCRSYGVSLKGKNAYTFHDIVTNKEDGHIYENKKSAFLFLSSPENGKKLTGSDPVLLDFYIVNFEIKKGGNFLKLTIDDTEIVLTKWCAYVVSGLSAGEHTFSIKAFNKEGKALSGNLLKEVTTTFEITEGITFE